MKSIETILTIAYITFLLIILCYVSAVLILQIQLSLGEESSIGIGWRKKEQKVSASGEIKVASFCS